jgi:hypothetical protein
VDPFCGKGTLLAVANAMGFDAIGVDRSPKRCRAARALVLCEDRGTDAGAAPRGDRHAPAGPPRGREVGEALRTGARRFDAGAFWQAHEIWEDAWRDAVEPGERRRLQGLIQVAAAFHQLVVLNNADAAVRLLTRALAKLQPAVPDPAAHGLARFCAEVAAYQRGLAAHDPSGSPAPVPVLGDAAWRDHSAEDASGSST